MYSIYSVNWNFRLICVHGQSIWSDTGNYAHQNQHFHIYTNRKKKQREKQNANRNSQITNTRRKSVHSVCILFVMSMSARARVREWARKRHFISECTQFYMLIKMKHWTVNNVSGTRSFWTIYMCYYMFIIWNV